jgi:hypothetical protein
MATRNLAVTGEKILASETHVVTSIGGLRAFLPDVADGLDDTVAVGSEILLENNSNGYLELLTPIERQLGVLPAFSRAILRASAGQLQSEPDRWQFTLQ